MPQKTFDDNRDHFVFASSPWETKWHCNVASHWLDANIKWSLDKLTFVDVIAWCHQATSYYLNQYLLRSMTPYGATRSQWFTKDTNIHVPQVNHTCTSTYTFDILDTVMDDPCFLIQTVAQSEWPNIIFIFLISIHCVLSLYSSLCLI